MTSTRFATRDGQRVIEGDWYPGTVPDNARFDATAYVGSSHSFVRCRSELPACVLVGRGASLCDATSLDVGPHGEVHLGAYALVTAARIVCDARVEIGDYALVSWDVVLIPRAVRPGRASARCSGRAAAAADPGAADPARAQQLGRLRRLRAAGRDDR